MNKFLNSLRFAFSGIARCFKDERNLRIQVYLAFVVVCFGLYFRISVNEWIALLICCAMVICLEMLNTSIEKLADVVAPNFNNQIKVIKDIAAGAVLLASMFSIVIALIIFIPKIFILVN